MTKHRMDTVDSYFQNVNRMNTFSNILFWLSVFWSFSLFFTSPKGTANYLINIIFIITTVLYFVINNWLSLNLIREAQSRRRVHLLSDSLGVNLDDEQTDLYYNNSQNPSIIRLGLNVFENTLFTRRVTEVMAIRERIKVLLYIILFLLFVLIRNMNLELIAIVAQTIFTTGLIINYVKLELLRYSCVQLNNEFRQFFLTNGLSNNDRAFAIILSLVIRYETVVASMGLHLSSKIFHKLNPKVTEEWESVRRNVHI